MNVVLIGYRGTGKSTVARQLAAELGIGWVDADVELERRAGMSIAEMFREQGEEAFRQWECLIVAELCRRENEVIALGGGAVLREENRRCMMSAGRVVWLKASPEKILQRIEADPSTSGRRPNLTTSGGLEEVQSLLHQREPLYRRCAELEIETDDLSPGQIARQIGTWLRQPITD